MGKTGDFREIVRGRKLRDPKFRQSLLEEREVTPSSGNVFADMGLPGAKKLKAEAIKGMFSGRVKKSVSVEEMDRGIEKAVSDENPAPAARRSVAQKGSAPAVPKISTPKS
jgi:hypothetical protein